MEDVTVIDSVIEKERRDGEEKGRRRGKGDRKG